MCVEVIVCYISVVFWDTVYYDPVYRKKQWNICDVRRNGCNITLKKISVYLRILCGKFSIF